MFSERLIAAVITYGFWLLVVIQPTDTLNRLGSGQRQAEYSRVRVILKQATCTGSHSQDTPSRKSGSLTRQLGSWHPWVSKREQPT